MSSGGAKAKTTVYLVAVVGSIFFGMTFLGAKIALEKLDAIEVLACRWTLAFILFAIFALTGIIKVNFRKKPVWLAMIMAFIQPCINTICETCGVDMTTASESAIMYAMIPIAVVLISRIFLKQKITARVGVGVAVSFAGIFVAIAFRSIGSGAQPGGAAGANIAGYLVLLGMVITGALFIIVSGKISDRFTAMERTFVMAAMAAVWFNGLNLVRGKGFECYAICFRELETGLAIVFLGAIGSFMCYIMLNYVVGRLPAPQVSSIQVNITSLTGVVTGILFQGDAFGWYTVVGMILIIAGIITCNMAADDKLGR